MKKLALLIVMIVGFLFSFFPLLAAGAYVFGGREGFMQFITKIPEGRFWLVGIPMFLSCFAATFFLLYYMFKTGMYAPKKKIYYLQDDSGNPGEVFDMDGNKVEFMNLGKKDSI
jgi:hypothetical protein